MGKAQTIRNTRRSAQLNRSQTRVYKRIKNWEEDNIGTDDEEYTLTLFPGKSFEKDFHLSKKGFPSAAEAMRGIRKIYDCHCHECKQNLAKVKRT